MTTASQDNGRCGIRIKAYCAAHEAMVRARLQSGGVSDALLLRHERRLGWLQHERLIHLIVLFIVAVLFLFTVGLFIVLGNPLVLILVGVVLTLLCAYIGHYFTLENTVQRWYLLYDEIYGALDSKSSV
jgi:hypothetical protein